MIKKTGINPELKPVRAPDPILAELWEVKRQINTEASFDIDTLARMAHEVTLNIQATRSEKAK
ncbi:MAG: hypothetical protein Q8O79_02830 [Pseudomonadota bacterium]|nr:hypothetical protein [Pseudomonadota bacterium]